MKKSLYHPTTPQEVNALINNLKMRYYTSPEVYGTRLLYTPRNKKKGYQTRSNRVLHTNNF